MSWRWIRDARAASRKIPGRRRSRNSIWKRLWIVAVLLWVRYELLRIRCVHHVCAACGRVEEVPRRRKLRKPACQMQ